MSDVSPFLDEQRTTFARVPVLTQLGLHGPTAAIQNWSRRTMKADRTILFPDAVGCSSQRGTPFGIVPQGSNEELSKGIVPWNFISCLALASMKKSETLDLMLGSIVLGALLAVIVVSGIVWNIV